MSVLKKFIFKFIPFFISVPLVTQIEVDSTDVRSCEYSPSFRRESIHGRAKFI